jgi:hypothetical protein
LVATRDDTARSGLGQDCHGTGGQAPYEVTRPGFVVPPGGARSGTVLRQGTTAYHGRSHTDPAPPTGIMPSNTGNHSMAVTVAHLLEPR